MKAIAILAAVVLTQTARAQSEPPAEAPQSPPSAPGASAPAPTPAPEAKGPGPWLIGDVAYEPGVGLRFKTPSTAVVLYGLVEATLSSVDNVNAAGDRKSGYQVAWFSGNRWGITGSQSLVKNHSLKGIFRLESEFELPTGNMDTDNVLFNRDCWVGFESSWFGKLTFGRQNTLARDFAQNYGDPYGTPNVTLEEGGWTNVNNFKQLIFFAGAVDGTRMNNGIVWKLPIGEHVVAGVGGNLAGDTGSLTRDGTLSAGLALRFDPVNVSGFFTTADHAGFNQKAYSIGGNIRYSIFRLNGGYFRYEADQGSLGQRTDDAFTVSASAKVAPISDDLDVALGYQYIKSDNFGYSSSGRTLNQFADSSSATTSGSGSKGTLYGSIVYHFNRATQIYVAFDYMKLSDGYAVNGAVAGSFAGRGGQDSQTEIATGTRLLF